MHERALIFDYGNVVAFFDYMKACERFGKMLGLSAVDFRDLIMGRGFGEMHARFECGQIAPENFAADLMAHTGLSLPYDDFVAVWQDIFWLNESIARLIGFFKSRGYTLLLGSNTNVLHASFFRRQFAPTLDLLDHLVLSYEVGHMKPDERFYAACASASGRAPAACVFIDDLAENIEGARTAGMTGLLYVDTPKLIADLHGLGIEVPAGEV
jgi:putative hydrolase of the HAD superfamily